MNFLGILSLLLITSSGVLCRRIRRLDLEDGVQNEFSNLPKIGNLRSQENSSSESELRGFNSTLQENTAAVPEEVETADGSSSENPGKLDRPISSKRLGKMLKKAIRKIITGDLTTADMLLLKSLNYDAEQVRTIREEELRKRKDPVETVHETRKPRNRLDGVTTDVQSSRNGAFDYDAYNSQATYDYENAASNFESTNGVWNDSSLEYEDGDKGSTESSLEYEKPVSSNIVFKIDYNDSEFDSSSEEKPKLHGEENRQSAMNGTGNNFPAVVTSVNSSPAPVDHHIETFRGLWNFTKNYFTTTEAPIEDNEVSERNVPFRNQSKGVQTTDDILRFRYEVVGNSPTNEENRTGVSQSDASLSSTTTEATNVAEESTSPSPTDSHKVYKGLKWVQDNVYQVIPEFVDYLEHENLANETSESLYEDASYQNLEDVVVKNLTNNEYPYSNDAPESIQLFSTTGNVSVDTLANLTSYQQMTATRRETQKHKTEEDIKLRVLWITGRLNSTGNNTPVQPRREKLTMFSPVCEIPRNTDADAWQDPYIINMQFHLNLTSDQHLVAARLRLFKLPQANSTATTSTPGDGLEDEEKKIRISVYYYWRSLRKHRSKKRLMDSMVTPLTTTGGHLALDVKQGARYWRVNSRISNNHGLVVMVEDQEGRPLQPSHYIQTPNCHDPAYSELQDQKAFQRVPALFVGACTRYVRVVGEKMITHEYCGEQSDRLRDYTRYEQTNW